MFIEYICVESLDTVIKILMSHGEIKPGALNIFVIRERGKTGVKRLRRDKGREGGVSCPSAPVWATVRGAQKKGSHLPLSQFIEDFPVPGEARMGDDREEGEAGLTADWI